MRWRWKPMRVKVESGTPTGEVKMEGDDGGIEE